MCKATGTRAKRAQVTRLAESINALGSPYTAETTRCGGCKAAYIKLHYYGLFVTLQPYADGSVTVEALCAPEPLCVLTPDALRAGLKDALDTILAVADFK